jgi:hypothetical protein
LAGWAVVADKRPVGGDVAVRSGRGRNPGTKVPLINRRLLPRKDLHMDAIIYLVGLVVVVMAILSFFGLR